MSKSDPKKRYKDFGDIEEDDNLDAWLLPYGNMMTILMVFFLILFSFTFLSSDVNYEKLVTKIQSDFANMDIKSKKEVDKKLKETELAAQTEKYLKEKGLDKYAKVEINAQKMRIILTSPVLFNTGRADVTEHAGTLLSAVSQMLKGISNEIVVEGHTDDVPISTKRYASNWELSVDRAISVVNYMVNEMGFPADRLAVAGYGEYQPLFLNDTPSNRAKNRRIEIVVWRG